MMSEVSDEELLQVIKDFLEMGHVDNIVAMFQRDTRYYAWTGAILNDARFNVRLGVLVLFEELKHRQPEQLAQAVASLVPLLKAAEPHIRGEAASVLGVIATPEACTHIQTLLNDENPQVREIVIDIMTELDAAQAPVGFSEDSDA